ncbi:hypothetical protein AG1IA_07455 [Rhizoctonia solani AG-1 IA]|uniref:Uncharacterized protein n=1 Tax=Thanatephorus cucumeris (strain AG1-IA) TaxID=983506 RepID=L8WQ98_THACA|nr:hypothetical protein AG1IA_07455 [Rhizoctonia solani AG-1 IA]
MGGYMPQAWMLSTSTNIEVIVWLDRRSGPRLACLPMCLALGARRSDVATNNMIDCRRFRVCTVLASGHSIGTCKARPINTYAPIVNRVS